MNRTDRLLAIVLELQGKGRQRAEDLAATFETSKRTIYRDIQALGEAGVPLISVPGRGYSLMKGYFLPPLSFSTDEATMLLLGGAAQSASRKIEGVLPEKLRDEVHYLQNSIRFVSSGNLENVAETEMVRQLRRAIIECTTARFRYHTRYARDGQHEQQTREADPYGLVHFLNSWHLVAYCHLRQDIRTFRLDRMERLELLSQTFQRPANFQMQNRRQAEQEGIVVRARFNKVIARWVRESRSYYTIAEEDSPEGLLVTLKVRQENEVLQWLLSWGRHVQVLEPPSLRKRMAEEAEAIRSNYQ